MERTCENCVKSKLCFAFKGVFAILLELPAAKTKLETPGNEADVIKALANSCREYQQKKQ